MYYYRQIHSQSSARVAARDIDHVTCQVQLIQTI